MEIRYDLTKEDLIQDGVESFTENLYDELNDMNVRTEDEFNRLKAKAFQDSLVDMLPGIEIIQTALFQYYHKIPTESIRTCYDKYFKIVSKLTMELANFSEYQNFIFKNSDGE